MTDVCILASESHLQTASNLAMELHSFGVSTSVRSSSADIESVLKCVDNANLVAAILSDEINQASYISYFYGRGKRIVAIDPGTENCPAILQCMERIAFDKSVIQKVVALCRSGDVAKEVDEIPADSFEFLEWAERNFDRIQDLSPSQFERLIAVLLSKAGLGEDLSTNESTENFFADFAHRSKIFVECKRFAKDSRIDVNTVRQSLDLALLKRCDSAILATNATLTTAASLFSATCVPPLWHIGLDAIQTLLAKVIEERRLLPEKEKPQLSCAVRDYYPHYDSAGSLLDGLCVSGIHKLASQSWLKSIPSFQRLEDPSRWNQQGLFVLFFVGHGRQEDCPNEPTRSFLQRLDSLGIRVWHNSPDLTLGHRCLDLHDFSRATHDSSILLIFDDIVSPRSFDDNKILNWVASEYVKTHSETPAVISSDGCRTRLRLPRCFADSMFIDKSDWSKFLTESLKHPASGSHVERSPRALPESVKSQ